MAKNLRARISEGDKLVIFDRNSETTSKFLKEVGIAESSLGAKSKGTGIEIVNSPREVVQKSVSAACLHVHSLRDSMMSLFYR